MNSHSLGMVRRDTRAVCARPPSGAQRFTDQVTEDRRPRIVLRPLVPFGGTAVKCAFVLLPSGASAGRRHAVQRCDRASRHPETRRLPSVLLGGVRRFSDVEVVDQQTKIWTIISFARSGRPRRLSRFERGLLRPCPDAKAGPPVKWRATRTSATRACGSRLSVGFGR
jgi:hypothetical protein